MNNLDNLGVVIVEALPHEENEVVFLWTNSEIFANLHSSMNVVSPDGLFNADPIKYHYITQEEDIELFYVWEIKESLDNFKSIGGKIHVIDYISEADKENFYGKVKKIMRNYNA